ncbi:MAG TPA: hypothetical protein PKA28_12360 [Methylomusa anaerophila]|uniref:Uncharacterized protein n=1 Tax=Methylomusa anaerophila TaxID=1930071 RepID=A0A348AF81_9FIRM|nr:hypothetical protein [Methylomusa anaerophila]BBB89729.1 hypothetical protein MAMMFC1_00363 [Methylomusa anaerophila]HML89225.1 hypothetical protein [Methylomusa anaerophila]
MPDKKADSNKSNAGNRELISERPHKKQTESKHDVSNNTLSADDLRKK